MATGPEHYAMAEELIKEAMDEDDERMERYQLASAHVHATLALAAATALSVPDRSAPRATIHEWAAWQSAAGVPAPTDD